MRIATKPGMKKCLKCKSQKTKDQFRATESVTGRFHECMECEAQRPVKQLEAATEFFNEGERENWLV